MTVATSRTTKKSWGGWRAWAVSDHLLAIGMPGRV